MYNKIFVYGSLMKDFFNYNKYLEGKVVKIEQGYIKGSLYHLNNKGYPGFINEGMDYVYGEIITYEGNGQVLEALDNLEDYSGQYDSENAYNRCRQDVFNMEEAVTLKLDVYVYNKIASCNINDDRHYLQEGSWRKHMEK